MHNHITLIGLVGKDPAIKNFDNGNKIAEFSLATSSKYKNKQDEWVEETQWHNIKITNPSNATACEKWVHKGMLLHVEGTLKYRKYTNNEGATVTIAEIISSRFITLEKREASDTETTATGTEQTSNNAAADDDLPF